MDWSLNHCTILTDNGGVGSDSDSIGDDSPEYYQPISAEADDGELKFFNGENPIIDDDEQFDPQHSLPNGYASYMENGVLSLNLRDDEDNIVEEDDDEEEERTREESDMAIRRAFREDENRRNAPLTPENSLRVTEAMRGISFGGIAPDWAGQIPEDQWINQLRGLRRSSQVSSVVQD